MSEVLALILARGGSKGIPKKNLRLLAGRPLVAYSIEQALGSGLVNRVIVSTDDPEIAAVAVGEGAEVPFMRPADLAQDMTPDRPVFAHALEWLQANEGYRPELVVHLRPTSPLREIALIDKAIGLMIEHPEADGLKSVCSPTQTPHRMWRVAADGFLEPLLGLEGFDEPYNLPRQQLPQVLWQVGYVDVVRPRVILEENMMHGRRIIPLFVPEGHIEIDEEEDLALAEEALRDGEHGADTHDKPHRRRYAS